MRLLSGQGAYPRQRSMAVVNRGPHAAVAPQALQAHAVNKPWYAALTPGQLPSAFKIPQPTTPVTGTAAKAAAQKTPPLGPPDPWDKWSGKTPPADTSGAGTDSGHSTDPYFDWLSQDLNNQIATLQQTAQKQRRDILLGFGSQALAKKYLGNDPTIATISDAPTAMTTLGKLNYGYGINQKNTNESLNAANLFYGGARNVALSQLSHQHLSDINDATRAVQDMLNNIDLSTASSIADLKRQLMAAYIQSQQGG